MAAETHDAGEPVTATGRHSDGSLPLAAHLVTPRKGFLHHGLYVGNGRVIHYAGMAGGISRRTVEEVSLEEFARGHEVQIRATVANFTGEEVLYRARSRLGENRYRILTNNCEHFCEWCLHGRSRSAQAEALRTRPLVRSVALLIDARIAVADLLRGLIQAHRRNRNEPLRFNIDSRRVHTKRYASPAMGKACLAATSG